MAFLAAAPAVLSFLGAGTTVGSAIALGATVAGGLLSARQSYVAGKHEQIQAKIAEQKEVTSARQEEIGRRRDLLRALASRAAFAGAQGVTMEGTLAALARADIDEASRDLTVLRGNSQSIQRGLRQRGRSAKEAGYAGAATSLLDTVGRVGGLG